MHRSPQHIFREQETALEFGPNACVFICNTGTGLAEPPGLQ